MITPRKVKFEAKKKENENIEFRTFLKCNADEKELDEQFKKLHEELFAKYDCSRCRNCCKMYCGSIPEEDLEKDAEYLGLTKEELINSYLIKKESENTYVTKHHRVISWKKTETVSWENINLRIAGNIHIRISQRGYIVCTVYWKQ